MTSHLTSGVAIDRPSRLHKLRTSRYRGTIIEPRPARRRTVSSSTVPAEGSLVLTESSTKAPDESSRTEHLGFSLKQIIRSRSLPHTCTASQPRLTLFNVANNCSIQALFRRRLDRMEALPLGQDDCNKVVGETNAACLKTQNGSLASDHLIGQTKNPCLEASIICAVRSLLLDMIPNHQFPQIQSASVSTRPISVVIEGTSATVTTVSDSVRLVITATPLRVSGMHASKAMLTSSAGRTNQSDSISIFAPTEAATIMWPNGTSIAPHHHENSSAYNVDVPTGGHKNGHKNLKIIGAVVGSLLGVLILTGLLWCFWIYKRRQQRARRFRELRDSNPVSSRITTSSYL